MGKFCIDFSTNMVDHVSENSTNVLSAKRKLTEPSLIDSKRVFPCDQCAKRFTRHENLTRHKACHSKAEPIPCPYCEIKCKRKDLLKRHIQRFHNDKSVIEEGSKDVLDVKAAASQQEDNMKIVLPSFDAIDVPKAYHPSLRPYFTILPLIPSDFLEHYIEGYFEWFHPVFPFIHQASFNSENVAASFLRSLVVIACLCTGIESDFSMALLFWDSGFHVLQLYLQGDPERVKKAWVFQSRLLFCTASLFEKTACFSGIGHVLLKDLVHESRTFGWTKLNWSVEGDTDISNLIDLECIRRSVFCLYILEWFLALIFNKPPSLSVLELQMPLPISSALWSSKELLSKDYWRPNPLNPRDALSILVNGPLLLEETNISGFVLLFAIFEFIRDEAKLSMIGLPRQPNRSYEIMLQHLKVSMELSNPCAKTSSIFLCLWHLVLTYYYLPDPLFLRSITLTDLESATSYFKDDSWMDDDYISPCMTTYNLTMGWENVIWGLRYAETELTKFKFDLPVPHLTLFRIFLQGLYALRDFDQISTSSLQTFTMLWKKLSTSLNMKEDAQNTAPSTCVKEFSAFVASALDVEGGWGIGPLLTKAFRPT